MDIYRTYTATFLRRREKKVIATWYNNGEGGCHSNRYSKMQAAGLEEMF